MSSKAFRVFNKRTRRVEENLHVEFLENKAIEKGIKNATIQEVKKDVSSLRYIALPNWVYDALLELSSTDQMETLTVESPIPTVSSPVPTACFTDSLEPSSDARLILKKVANKVETPSLDNILTLTNRFEDILGVTKNSDESNGVEADVSNMETTITASPTPTLKIHKDHPKFQIIGPMDTPIQTRNKSKEVLKNKKDERGIVIRNKARLVAQRHTQEEGIDYDEVFAPVARIEAIRLFLAYASFMGFYSVPDGCEECIPLWQRGDFILVQVYVDDIIFGSSNPQVCREFEALMHEKFQMSAMDVRSSNIPMDKKNPWGKDETGKDIDLHLYRSRIGSLMYLTASRPYIMFDVYACARHQVTPKECHMHAVKRIFRYLKGHPKVGLWYPKESPFDLVAYSDSDYGGATQDRKSTTGGCQFLGRKLISWQYKKQTIVATSTTEAEYVVAANLLTKPFDAGRFQYLVYKLFLLLGKLFTVSVFLGFGLTLAGTSKYWGVLRILMISVRLIPLVSKEKGEHNVDFHPIVDFVEASPLRIVPLFDTMLVPQGEGSGTPTEPHHIPSPEAHPPSHTTHSSPTHPPVTTASIPTVTPYETKPIRQYT
nr:hypothetical protein [Tanacetum cinerariifolium]